MLGSLALVPTFNFTKLVAAKLDPPPNAGPQLPGRIVHNQMSMRLLASFLSRFERQTVVDLTGIAGFFEVKLEWAPATLSQNDVTAAPCMRPSLFAAVHHLLGLQLSARRGRWRWLSMEQAAKVPDEN